MDYIVLFLATAVAVAIVEIFRKRLTKTTVDLVSGFTGAFVLGIIVFHMLPEIYGSEMTIRATGFCIMGGLLIQAVLDFFTKGIDHGHTHTEHCTHTHHSHDHAHGDDNSLTIGMFVSLFLHTFLESTPILAGDVHGHAHDHGLTDSPLLFSIAVHTIPMAIVLYVLVLRTVKNRVKALSLMALFALSGPLGMLIGAQTEIFHRYYFAALAVVVGILLHVSSVMLFDCDMAAYGKARKLVIIVAGFIAAMVLVL